MEGKASIAEFSKGKIIKDIKIIGLPDKYDDRWHTNFKGKKLRIDFIQGSSILIDSLWNSAEFLTTQDAIKRVG